MYIYVQISYYVSYMTEVQETPSRNVLSQYLLPLSVETNKHK